MIKKLQFTTWLDLRFDGVALDGRSLEQVLPVHTVESMSECFKCAEDGLFGVFNS